MVAIRGRLIRPFDGKWPRKSGSSARFAAISGAERGKTAVIDAQLAANGAVDPPDVAAIAAFWADDPRSTRQLAAFRADDPRSTRQLAAFRADDPRSTRQLAAFRADDPRNGRCRVRARCIRLFSACAAADAPRPPLRVPRPRVPRR